MASLENRTGYFNIVFRFGGRKYTRSLKTDNGREAENRKLRLEENIRLIDSGRLDFPDGADVATFLLSDGKLNQKPEASDSGESWTISGLFETFFSMLPEGNLESSTVKMMQTHRSHLCDRIGNNSKLQDLTTAELQSYVNKRSKQAGRRGKKVSPTTIKKELGTFRSVWNSQFTGDHPLRGRFPRIRDLRFRKTDERPPFQTWDEIERAISSGHLTDDEYAALWECLYLRASEIQQLLKYIDRHATQPWVYPMAAMAAYTGARRSELLRSEVLDISDDTVLVRERKRMQSGYTTRRVPLSATLKNVMDTWLAAHPGGRFTFCQTAVIRSKKRRPEPEAVTRDEAHDHLQRTLRGSKWEHVPGWHCLRHSFISNLASQGVDQRMIDEFVGHSTEQQRRRYRHLFPETKAKVLQQVFG